VGGETRAAVPTTGAAGVVRRPGVAVGNGAAVTPQPRVAPGQQQANTLWVEQVLSMQEGEDAMAEHECRRLAVDVRDRHPVSARVPAAAGDEGVDARVPSEVVAEGLHHAIMPGSSGSGTGAATLIISRAVR
jgi:hypothetical protein